MKRNTEFEYGSRFENGQRPAKKGGLMKIFFVIFVMVAIAAWSVKDMEIDEELAISEENIFKELLEEDNNDVTVANLASLKEMLEESLDEKIEEEEEGSAAEFYYSRGLERDGEKDFTGAVEDYTKAIELANKYSFEMWNALNNRGIIKAQQY